MESSGLFPITGDSMPPHRDGSFIVGSYVRKLSDITNGKNPYSIGQRMRGCRPIRGFIEVVKTALSCL